MNSAWSLTKFLTDMTALLFRISVCPSTQCCISLHFILFTVKVFK